MSHEAALPAKGVITAATYMDCRVGAGIFRVGKGIYENDGHSGSLRGQAEMAKPALKEKSGMAKSSETLRINDIKQLQLAKQT